MKCNRIIRSLYGKSPVNYNGMSIYIYVNGIVIDYKRLKQPISK